ncbi:MAG TPA: hypothetical protein VFQ44_05255 [Streptosporangiaceae bacterium]|nr:hypothetical protein [Streptosporangiaceae bacterium]
MTLAPKDERLADLALRHNVAQFVSFSPGHDPDVRFACIRGYDADLPRAGLRSTIDSLLIMSQSRSLNIRTFLADKQKGNPFIYALQNADEIESRVRTLAEDGYFTIVNETIDTDDGGVSGVAVGGVIEFTPFDTPRGVEKPGTASLPYDLGRRMLSTVYGFELELAHDPDERVEFSVHPIRAGFARGHTVYWESERVRAEPLTASNHWPNRFSQLIGDKAYGLLLAHLIGLPVPATTVFPRAVAPFSFGTPTGTGEFWMRTSPPEPRPGHFPTTFGWKDPYALLAKHDPHNAEIASVLSQENADALYSGATLYTSDETADYIEGVAGAGDDFMLGQRSPDQIPGDILADVRKALASTRHLLGATRAEFVHDGRQPWIVQLHRQRQAHPTDVIRSGEPLAGWLDFDPTSGLEVLEDLIQQAEEQDMGIQVTAQVGLTSHVGDLLRRAGTPARFAVAAS